MCDWSVIALPPRRRSPTSFCLDIVILSFSSSFLPSLFFALWAISCRFLLFYLPRRSPSTGRFIAGAGTPILSLILSSQALQAYCPCLTYSLTHASSILSHLHCSCRHLSPSRSGVRSTDTGKALHQGPPPSSGEWKPSHAAIFHANRADYPDVRGMTIFCEPL